VPLPAGAYAQLRGLRGLARVNLVAWGVRVERAEEIELVLSELVANALRHTSGPARVRLHIRHRVVFLQVSDTSEKPGRGDGPYLEADWPHGLGVVIAERLADRVGTRIHAGLGKTVTAEFDLG
jgi:anti-sigma regulatory factor (Ser/Thr protein kinase)